MSLFASARSSFLLILLVGCGGLDAAQESRVAGDGAVGSRSEDETLLLLDETIYEHDCWTITLPEGPGHLEVSSFGPGFHSASATDESQACSEWGMGGTRCTLSDPVGDVEVCATTDGFTTLRVRYTPGHVPLAAPACEDDENEPNDRFHAYAPLPEGHSQTVTPTSPVDVFELVIPSGTTHEIAATGGVDLVLYTFDGTPVDHGGVVSHRNPAGSGDTTFLVAVYALDDWSCTEYSLTQQQVEVETSECGTSDDSWEDPIWTVDIASGSLWNGDSSDWYAFYVPAYATLHTDAYFSDSDGDVDLYLYGADGTLLGNATTATDDESLAWANGGFPREVRLEVQLFGTSECVPYDLDWGVSF